MYGKNKQPMQLNLFNPHRLIAVVLCIFSIFSLNAQEFEWLSVFGKVGDGGGVSHIYPTTSVTDNSGNTFIVGTIQGSGDFDPSDGLEILDAPLDTSFVRGMWIAKYDTEGALVWAELLGAPEGTVAFVDFFPEDVAINASNTEICITGLFRGEADFDPGIPIEIVATEDVDSYRGFAASFTVDGEYNWSHLWYGEVFGFGGTSGIKYNSSGDIFISGAVNAATDFDPGPGVDYIDPLGTTDGFLIKLTGDGDYLWTKTVRGSGAISISEFGINEDDEIVLAGFFDGNPDFDPDPFDTYYVEPETEENLFILKLNADAEFLWVNILPCTFIGNEFNDVVFDDELNIYLCGDFEGEVDFNPGDAEEWKNAYDAWDVFLTKYSTDGDYLWTSVLEGESSTRTSGMVITPENELFLSGFIRNGAVDFDPGPGEVIYETPLTSCSGGGYVNFDFYLVGLNSDGEYLWGRSSLGENCESVGDISIDPSGNLYITGDHRGTVDFDLDDVDTHISIPAIDGPVFLEKLSTCPASFSSILEYACGSYTVPSGDETYYESGVYQDTIVNAFGCDSLISINLTIGTLDAYVIVDGTTLTAYPEGLTYQWHNCKTGFIEPIPGETDQVFVAEADGFYSVVVSDGDCVDTTECYSPVGVGIEDLESLDFSVYPNPSTGMITISSSNSFTIQLYNAIGEVVLTEQIVKGTNSLDLNHLSNGVYHVVALTEKGKTLMNEKVVLSR